MIFKFIKKHKVLSIILIIIFIIIIYINLIFGVVIAAIIIIIAWYNYDKYRSLERIGGREILSKL